LPPVVLVHGFGCSHADWQPQIEHLSKDHVVEAPDLRGHGATPGQAADCSIETYGADVARLLAERDLAGAVLVGHSMGCRVVLQAALDAPGRVAGLVLVDGSKLGSGDPSAAEQAVRESIAATGYAAFARSLFEQMFVASSPAALRAAIVERALALPAAIGAELFARLVGWDARRMEQALAAVGVPLLVIQSTYLDPERGRVPIEPGVTTPWLDTVRRRAPGARIEIVPGVGHFPQLEAPERVNRLIEAFAVGL
jgi:pimeloyl-ACP methyl ester carboxylesterase